MIIFAPTQLTFTDQQFRNVVMNRHKNSNAKHMHWNEMTVFTKERDSNKAKYRLFYTDKLQVNALTKVEVLDLSKSKAFADDKLNMLQTIGLVCYDRKYYGKW